jgi:cellulose synthase/poly-beta-1,6-N-acetylglucosamine synthase-like glycosyltransferase
MAQAVPSVSIVIPAWGAAAYLGETLGSVLAQTRTDWEAVVVDDGDTGPVAAAFAPFAGDARIRLIATSNGGPSAARNRGIAASHAPLVSMLDGDDRYRPDYLERMIAKLDEDPRIGFVTSDAMMFGTPAFEGRIFSSMQPQSGEISLERVILRQYNIVGGGSVVRRPVLEAVGGYDERLRSAEDLDLWIRILEGGWRGARVDAPLLEYRRRPGSLSATSLSLARWDRQVYAQAVERLEGKPEQAAARRMLAKADNQLRIEEGIAAVLDHRTREGLALLKRTDIAKSSRKWRAAMTVFRLCPPLAGPVIRFYMRGHHFAGPGAASS